MKKESKRELFNILAIALSIVLLLGPCYCFHQYRLKRFKTEPNCFAKTLKISYSTNADGYPFIDYEFKVDNTIYDSSEGINEKTRDRIKDTMTVRYLCNDPEINRLVEFE